jgi:3-dehydroquinate synthase
MKTLRVTLPRQSYDIHIGRGLLSQTGEKLKELGFSRRAVIITNPAIGALYAAALRRGLESAGFEAVLLEVPEGEKYKTLSSAGFLYRALSRQGAERMTPVLALGGGVIGDLAGFVAATYMRGVPLVQVPTTLLAQVDSSTGGKVAVDQGRLKNIVGSFYQPSLVLADISTLKTLPGSEFNNGMAELIKHAIIRDKELFARLEGGLGLLRSMDGDFLEEVIYRSVGIKAGVVEKDERDMGLRNILNYGHTVGHALESVSGFAIKHGSGVAIGMVAATLISQRMGFLAADESDRVIRLIKNAGLPASHSLADSGKIMRALQQDKKRAGGRVRFILLRSIGEVFLSDQVDLSLVEEVVKELYA